MAASRTRPKKADSDDAALLDAARAAVRAAHEQLESQRVQPAALRRAPRRVPLVVLVGASGGLDSSVLLHLLARLVAERGSGLREVVAGHVHHGLSRHADAWQAHVAAQAEALGLRFVTRRVQVQRAGRGLEAAAREARYRALADIAAEAGASVVCCAHHRDDRLETFLIQWLRGAGPEGLAAFPPARTFGGPAGALLLRPLLDVPREELAAYAERHGIVPVHDESNDDRTLLRNALRHDVLPRLDALRPGFRAAAARSVELVAEAADALRSVAESDLAACTRGAPDGMLRLDALWALPAARQPWTVRAWLAAHGLEAPPRARLLELLAQARGARSDARLLLRLGDAEVRRYRGLLLVRPAGVAVRDSAAFSWRGEAEIALPEWGGALRFERVHDAEGFDPEWLAAMPLEARPRAGGERFKPNAARPSRTLKRLYQDAGIPEFDRPRLPLVWRDGELIFVAGLGADVRLTDRDGERVRIAWQPAATLLSPESA
jgi:tRNA(Ile)-lysidine synthase